MDGLYGKISDEQLADFKKKLHSKIHWLLVYKEEDSFDIDYDTYFTDVMKYIGSACEVLAQDSVALQIMTMLKMAYDETVLDEFNHSRYRHYILEAHNLVDRLGVDK